MFDERLLIDTKWFDYRPLAINLCNYMCLREFITHRMDWAKQRSGNAFAYPFSSSAKINGEKVTVSPRISEIHEKWPYWRKFVEVRQYADSKCLRYQDFWRNIFSLASGIPGRLAFPQITTPKMTARAATMCLEERSQRILMSEEWYLAPTSWADIEFQNDYYWYVVNSVKSRYGNGRLKEIIDLLIAEGQFPEGFYKNYLEKKWI